MADEIVTRILTVFPHSDAELQQIAAQNPGVRIVVTSQLDPRTLDYHISGTIEGPAAAVERVARLCEAISQSLTGPGT